MVLPVERILDLNVPAVRKKTVTYISSQRNHSEKNPSLWKSERTEVGFSWFCWPLSHLNLVSQSYQISWHSVLIFFGYKGQLGWCYLHVLFRFAPFKTSATCGWWVENILELMWVEIWVNFRTCNARLGEKRFCDCWSSTESWTNGLFASPDNTKDTNSAEN